MTDKDTKLEQAKAVICKIIKEQEKITELRGNGFIPVQEIEKCEARIEAHRSELIAIAINERKTNEGSTHH